MSGDADAGGAVPGAVHTRAQLGASTPPPGSIVPHDGYEVITEWGLQRFDDTDAGRLLRLDEALHWLVHGREWPRGKAVYAVFSPLVQWDEADGQDRRQVLYMLNHQDYAYPLSLGDRLNPRAVDVWGDLAFSYSDTYSQGTVREVADLWDASWPGYPIDPQTFYRDGWVSYCKTMKGLAKAAVGVVDWEVEYRKRYYMDLGAWKERCKKAVQSLRRLAVPIGVAHELWGYGHVQAPAAAVATLSVVAAPAEVVEVFPLKDFDALVEYRRGKKADFVAAGKPNKNAPWVTSDPYDNQVATLKAKHKELGGDSAAATEIGLLLGCARQTVESALLKEQKPLPIDFAAGLGARAA